MTLTPLAQTPSNDVPTNLSDQSYFFFSANGTARVFALDGAAFAPYMINDAFTLPGAFTLATGTRTWDFGGDVLRVNFGVAPPTTAVPEPTTVLSLLGLIGGAFFRRKRRKLA